MDEAAASSMLDTMRSNGMVNFKKVDGERLYGLPPFIVGIYEAQLPRVDEGLAALVEQYFQETRMVGMIAQEPGVHRVIPVDEAIPFGVEIFPYEKASQLIEEARSWGIRKCICRVQRHLIGKGCDNPVESCISFAPVEGFFDSSEIVRSVTKEEALEVLHEAEECGMIHTTENVQGPIYYICNCCPCCCGIIRGVVEFGIEASVARSDFRARVDTEACTGCETCIDRCHFGALAVSEDVCTVDYARCVGCGLCVSVCPTDALSLERRPEGDQPSPPADEMDWMAQRAERRGIDLSDIA
jgi:ferredoxin